MSNYDPNVAIPGAPVDQTFALDAGLRAHMLRVYNYMATGVGLTGLVAMLTYQFTGPELLQSPLMWVFMLAPFALVFFISARINKLSVKTARLLFFVYAALVGISFRQSSTSTRRLDHACVLYFGRDLRGAQYLGLHHPARPVGIRTCSCLWALIGIVIASLVNLFLRSAGLDWIISIVGVGVFAGLTAYDTQRIKGMYDSNDDATSTGRKAVIGALSLYLNFINLFMMLLRLAGNRR